MLRLSSDLKTKSHVCTHARDGKTTLFSENTPKIKTIKTIVKPVMNSNDTHLKAAKIDFLVYLFIIMIVKVFHCMLFCNIVILLPRIIFFDRLRFFPL